MRFRGFRRALALFLLPFALALAGDVDDWSDAPPAWTAGLDLFAFCRPGEWTFETEGESAAAGAGAPEQRQDASVAAIFFVPAGNDEVVWIKDGPKPDELTSLRITRGDDGVLVFQAFAGKTLAVWRKFQFVTSSGLLRTRKADATHCRADQPALVEMDYYIDSWSGGNSVSRARLALAEDHSLIVRQDSYSCWLCLRKNRTRQFARFRAIEARGAETIPD